MKILVLLLLLSTLTPLAVSAAPAEYCGFGPFRVPCPYGTADTTPGAGPGRQYGFGPFVQSIIEILLIVAGSIAVIYLIVGGYRYVTAHGNEEASEGAKKTMTSAILGLVIILLSFVIIRIVASLVIKGTTDIGF